MTDITSDAAERDMSLRPFNKPKYLATLNTLYSLSGVSPPILHITVDMTNMLEKNHRDFFHYIRAFKRDSLGILVSWIRQGSHQHDIARSYLYLRYLKNRLKYAICSTLLGSGSGLVFFFLQPSLSNI